MPPPRPYEDRPQLPGAGRVEDYTTPFLIVAGMLCYVALFTLWAMCGLPVALVSAVLVDRVIPRS